MSLSMCRTGHGMAPWKEKLPAHPKLGAANHSTFDVVGHMGVNGRASIAADDRVIFPKSLRLKRYDSTPLCSLVRRGEIEATGNSQFVGMFPWVGGPRKNQSEAHPAAAAAASPQRTSRQKRVDTPGSRACRNVALQRIADLDGAAAQYSSEVQTRPCRVRCAPFAFAEQIRQGELASIIAERAKESAVPNSQPPSARQYTATSNSPREEMIARRRSEALEFHRHMIATGAPWEQVAPATNPARVSRPRALTPPAVLRSRETSPLRRALTPRSGRKLAAPVVEKATAIPMRRQFDRARESAVTERHASPRHVHSAKPPADSMWGVMAAPSTAAPGQATVRQAVQRTRSPTVGTHAPPWATHEGVDVANTPGRRSPRLAAVSPHVHDEAWRPPSQSPVQSRCANKGVETKAATPHRRRFPQPSTHTMLWWE